MAFFLIALDLTGEDGCGFSYQDPVTGEERRQRIRLRMWEGKTVKKFTAFKEGTSKKLIPLDINTLGLKPIVKLCCYMLLMEPLSKH